MIQKLHIGRLITSGVIASYGILCALTPSTFRFFDRVDLVFHEAGHLILTPFGQFPHMIGGTLGQLFFPLGCFTYFWRQEKSFSAAVVLFWIGQNLFNISVYMKDAFLMQLPLVGGEQVIHDWNWIFRKLHLLAYAHTLGNLVYLLGLIVIIANIGGMFYFSQKHFN